MAEQDNNNKTQQTPASKKEDLLKVLNETPIAVEPPKPPQKESNGDNEMFLFIKKQTQVIEQQKSVLAAQEKALKELREEVRELKENQSIQINTLTELDKSIEKNESVSIGKISESYYKSKIDEKDILKEEIVFSAYGIGIGFGSYMKNGQEVLAPYGMIMFKYQGTDVNASGDSKHFSVYKTRSKKELEFIRNHPGYGRLFSENLNYTLSTDHQKHIRMAQVYTNLMNLTSDQIISMADYYGVANHGEIHKLREQLASIKMKEIDEQEKSKHSSFAKEQEKIALLRKEVE